MWHRSCAKVNVKFSLAKMTHQTLNLGFKLMLRQDRLVNHAYRIAFEISHPFRQNHHKKIYPRKFW